jgi:AmmeMemoRadiSam system protein A
MSTDPLSEQEKQSLLWLARETIKAGVTRRKLPTLPPEQLTAKLKEPGAVFVTLTIGGELRGCIGSLQAYQPLIEDVQAHAIDAAFNDYRFGPVSEAEVPLLKIEISRLTAPVPLPYDSPTDLLKLLKQNIDGVVLRDGGRSATFLPQVWEQLPTHEEFLSHLCQKMGASPSLWRQKVLDVSIYHVEEFHE